MPFVDGKCSNCGHVQPVDNWEEAWICEKCGAPFVVEKAIRECGHGAEDFEVQDGVLKAYHGEAVDVVIPSTVREIGKEAFEGILIQSVVIPGSVRVIGDGAFRACRALKSVEILENIRPTNIRDEAFSGCTSLTSITLPVNIFTIGDNAFSGCTSLTSVTLPEDILKIGDFAFSDCTSLTNVTMSDRVAELAEEAYAFSNTPYEDQ